MAVREHRDQGGGANHCELERTLTARARTAGATARVRVRVCPPSAVPAIKLAPLSSSPQGFDEYMNLVLDEAEEVNVKKKTRKVLGEQPAPAVKLSAPLRASLCTGCVVCLPVAPESGFS